MKLQGRCTGNLLPEINDPTERKTETGEVYLESLTASSSGAMAW